MRLTESGNILDNVETWFTVNDAASIPPRFKITPDYGTWNEMHIHLLVKLPGTDEYVKRKIVVVFSSNWCLQTLNMDSVLNGYADYEKAKSEGNGENLIYKATLLLRAAHYIYHKCMEVRTCSYKVYDVKIIKL